MAIPLLFYVDKAQITIADKYCIARQDTIFTMRRFFIQAFLDTQVSLAPTHVQYNLAEPYITLLNRI